MTPLSSLDLFKDAWGQDVRGRRAVPVLAFTKRVRSLPTSRRWLMIEHQCAGHWCSQVQMTATVLKPRPEVKAAFDRIAAENYGACGGWFEGPDLDPAVTRRYLDRLSELDLTCEDALELLCESVYPVDATASALRRVAEDGDDLVLLLNDSDARPVILFLSENSE